MPSFPAQLPNNYPPLNAFANCCWAGSCSGSCSTSAKKVLKITQVFWPQANLLPQAGRLHFLEMLLDCEGQATEAPPFNVVTAPGASQEKSCKTNGAGMRINIGGADTKASGHITMALSHYLSCGSHRCTHESWQSPGARTDVVN